MPLSPLQHDALTEVINIGFGKAAATLSTLTGKRVILNVPEIFLVPPSEMETALGEVLAGDVTTIHQVFTGKVSGNAVLILNQDSASILVDLVSGGPGEKRRLLASDREALQEIGNILLNAYVGSFGNILHLHIRFAAPQIQAESALRLLDSLTQDQQAQTVLSTLLLVKTEFVIGQGQISGYVLIIMGVESLEALLTAIDAMAG
jgi:chemotaxis protein CheC